MPLCVYRKGVSPFEHTSFSSTSSHIPKLTMATAIVRRKQTTNRGQRHACTSLVFTTTFIRTQQNYADRNTGGERRRKRGEKEKHKMGNKRRRITAKRHSKRSENAEMVLSHGPKFAPVSRASRVGRIAAFTEMRRRQLQGPAEEQQGSWRRRGL